MKEEEKFLENLKALIGASDVKPFARKCGVEEKSIRLYLEGSSLPTFKSILKIAKACDVSVCWLMTGKEGAEDYSEKKELSPAEEWLAEIRRSGGNIAEVNLDLYQEIPEFKEWWDKKRKAAVSTPEIGQRKEVA